jgi:hypothetical protein
MQLPQAVDLVRDGGIFRAHFITKPHIITCDMISQDLVFIAAFFRLVVDAAMIL